MTITVRCSSKALSPGNKSSFEPTAAEAVTPLKQLRLTRLATEYLTRHHLQECPCRFDVVSIHFDAAMPEIEIIQNAFDA